MNEIVSKFLDEAKAKEQEEIELAEKAKKAKRDELLLSLGLVQEGKGGRKYNKAPIKPFDKYDPEKKMYYYDTSEPVEVTEEEFEEIKKYAKYYKSDYNPNNENEDEHKLGNGAENTLNAINSNVLTIALILGVGMIVFAILSQAYSFILAGIGIILTYTIIWAAVKVYINISNNLHQINAKIK